MNLPATPPTQWPAPDVPPGTASTHDPSTSRVRGPSDDTIASTVIVVAGTVVAGVVAMVVLVGGLLLWIEQQPDPDSEGYAYALVAAFFFVLLCVTPMVFAALVGWRVRRANSTARIWPAIVVGLAAFPIVALAVWGSIEWAAFRGIVPLGWAAAAAVVVAYAGWLLAVVARIPVRWALSAAAVAIVLLGTVGAAGALNADRHKRAQRVDLITARGVAHALLADTTAQPEVNGWTIHEMTAFRVVTKPKIELRHTSGITMAFAANTPSELGGCNNKQCFESTALSDGTPVRKARSGALTVWEIDQPGGTWVLSTKDDPTDAMARDLMELMTPVSADTWVAAYEIYKPD